MSAIFPYRGTEDRAGPLLLKAEGIVKTYSTSNRAHTLQSRKDGRSHFV